MKRKLIIGLLSVILLTSAAVYYLRPEAKLPPGARADAVLVLKDKRRLILLNDGKPLKTYRISLGSNPVGHKTQEGDCKTPEGRYVIDYRNPKSRYHLALHISYPNSNDKAQARNRGSLPGWRYHDPRVAERF
ncbi:MAG: L,D-transpeptidase family protein [Armatimonadota bacterium]